jgi:hypothetical protein
MAAEMWKSSMDLGLTRLIADDLNNYTKNLNNVGITLQENEQDTLVWSGVDNKGILTVKSAYEALISLKEIPTCNSWEKNLWK